MSALGRRSFLGASLRASLALVVLPGSPALHDPGGELLAVVNDHRRQVGLSPLVPEERLTAAATAYAETLLVKGPQLDHFIDATTPWGRVGARGYRWAAVGEVLARGQTTPAEIVRAWLASPSHRAALLDPIYRECGFARRGFADHLFWVLDLASPAVTSWRPA